MNLTVLQEATSALFNMNLSTKRFGFKVTECNRVSVVILKADCRMAFFHKTSRKFTSPHVSRRNT